MPGDAVEGMLRDGCVSMPDTDYFVDPTRLILWEDLRHYTKANNRFLLFVAAKIV